MKKFWDYIRNDAGERVLRLEGPIDEDSFWGDEVTPAAFRDELDAEDGDVTVWINSPGGNVFAAAEIYTMLKDHKGKITVKIDAIAASAASVIAMAGDMVFMSPVSMLMIHDPMTIAMGNASDMEKAISTLNEVKESIINAYVAKTGMSRNKVAKLMSDETWMNAKKAVELGFADAILFADGKDEESGDEKEVEAVWQPYHARVMGQAILNRIVSASENDTGTDEDHVEANGDEETVEPAEAGVNESVKPSKGKKPEEDDPDEDDPDGDEPDGDDPDGDEPDKEDNPEEKKKPAKAISDHPVIGMDGKTIDGGMPYEILKDRLEWMR